MNTSKISIHDKIAYIYNNEHKCCFNSMNLLWLNKYTQPIQLFLATGMMIVIFAEANVAKLCSKMSSSIRLFVEFCDNFLKIVFALKSLW